MRNRGIELFLLSDPYQLPTSPPSQPSSHPLSSPGLQHHAQTEGLQSSALTEGSGGGQEPWEGALRELEAVLAAEGVPGWQGPACLAAAHLSLVQRAAHTHRYCPCAKYCS